MRIAKAIVPLFVFAAAVFPAVLTIAIGARRAATPDRHHH